VVARVERQRELATRRRKPRHDPRQRHAPLAFGSAPALIAGDGSGSNPTRPGRYGRPTTPLPQDGAGTCMAARNSDGVHRVPRRLQSLMSPLDKEVASSDAGGDLRPHADRKWRHRNRSSRRAWMCSSWLGWRPNGVGPAREWRVSPVYGNASCSVSVGRDSRAYPVPGRVVIGPRRCVPLQRSLWSVAGTPASPVARSPSRDHAYRYAGRHRGVFLECSGYEVCCCKGFANAGGTPLTGVRRIHPEHPIPHGRHRRFTGLLNLAVGIPAKGAWRKRFSLPALRAGPSLSRPVARGIGEVEVLTPPPLRA